MARVGVSHAICHPERSEGIWVFAGNATLGGAGKDLDPSLRLIA